MKQRSLRNTLFRLVGILAIQTIVILVGVIFVSLNLFQNTIVERQQLLTNSLVTQGNLFLNNTEQTMEIEALLINEFRLVEQRRLLDSIRQEYPRFASLQIINKSGLVVAESTDTRPLLDLDLSGEPFFNEVKSSHETQLTDPFLSLTTGDTALIIAAPLLENSEFYGVLAGEISLALLQEEVVEQANLGDETVSFIVDEQGTLVIHPNHNWVQERRNLANVPLVQAGLNGQEMVDFYYDSEQEMWMVGTVQIMDNGWPVLTSQPISVAARPLMTMFMVASFAFLLSLFLFIIVVSRKVSQITRPLSDLVDRANALAQGNFEESVVEQEGTPLIEINSLHLSFQRMAEAVLQRDKALAAQLEELRRAEAEMQQTQAFLNNVIENIPHMIFVKDAAELRYFLLNRATEAILDVKREQLLGKNDYDFFGPDEAAFFTAKDREVLAKKEPVDILEEVIQTQNYGLRAFHTKKVPIFDETGETIYLLGISEDITERKEAEEKIKAYAADLERSNQELESFAYVSSHDLQEPLRKIQTFSDRILNKYSDNLDERVLDYLERMQFAAARMQSLIVDLLAYSRIMTRQEPFVQVDLAEVVQGVITDLDMLIEEVDGRVDVADLDAIEADPIQMRQLFQNLINNSLKYHRDGVPPVIFIEGQFLDRDKYQISVRDNGIGFDEKYTDRIFGVFQRLHGRGEYEGTGVGLAVCRRIVERHHGQITAKSRQNEGATFIIELPLRQPFTSVY